MFHSEYQAVEDLLLESYERDKSRLFDTLFDQIEFLKAQLDEQKQETTKWQNIALEKDVVVEENPVYHPPIGGRVSRSFRRSEIRRLERIKARQKHAEEAS